MSRRNHIAAKLLALCLTLVALGWGGIALAKIVTPPSVDDLVGIWQVSAKGTEYEVGDSTAYKFGGKGIYTVTKIDNTTINMHYEGDGGSWDDVCTYANGIIATASSDDDTLGSWSYTSFYALKGKPGKLSGKGQWLENDFGEGWMDIGTQSMKQVQPK